MQVGLTGGIGSGKSAVARFFAEFGALVIDSDELAREAVAPGSAGLAAVSARWPEAVGPRGLDREALAEIVFKDEKQREELETIVHPIVRELAAQRAAGAGPNQMVVQMIPLLFERRLEDRFDETVLVVAPDDHRIARVILRDGTSKDRVLARMAAQISVDEARARADFVIENDADIAQLKDRTRSVYDRLTI